MKSNTYVALLTIFLIVVYPWVSGIQDDKSRDMTTFVPESALAYFEQHHGSLALKEFRESPLGSNFEAIDFLKTGKKIGLSESLLSDIEEILTFYSSAKDNKLLHEILGKMFAVAILSPINAKKYNDTKGYLQDNTIIISKPKHSAEGLEFLGESYVKFAQTHSVASAQYGNHHIKRIQINEETLSLVTIKGFFVMSLNERQLRRCIDTFDGESPALGGNNDFDKFRKNFEMSDRFFYLPVEDVRNLVVETVQDLSFPGKKLLLKELKTTVGFSNLGYGSWNNKASVVDKVMVQYDKYLVNNIVQKHTKIAPSRCSMLSLTTENPMAFYWSNTVKVRHILHYLENSTKKEPQIKKFWSTVESVTGKNTEQIFSLLGGEVSLVLEPGSKDNFFPFPLGMVFLKVKNVPELSSIFEKIIDEYDIPVSVKISGPIRYAYWTLSPQDGLQPLYGFWGDLLFFGNSSKLLRMIVEEKSKDLSLLDNMSVKVIDPGFTEKNNSVTYMNNVELIKVLQKLLNLIGMTVAIEDRETAFKVRAIIEEIINPLLDGASMYDKSSTRSYFTHKMVVVDSVTNKTISPNN
ncbi:MAG: DUF3352 domain-containing protein [Desulfobulbaceae bacterium]|nr:DUF3352 domain-containing protein [Desulfobulbaceae bacterium]